MLAGLQHPHYGGDLFGRDSHFVVNGDWFRIWHEAS